MISSKEPIHGNELNYRLVGIKTIVRRPSKRWIENYFGESPNVFNLIFFNS